MKQPWTALCLTAVMAFTAGCFERNEKITLNPDGSGMSELELSYNIKALPGMNKGTASLPPEAVAKKLAKDIIRAAQGVDAWKDVSYQATDDGRVHFKGTAYFKNVHDFTIAQAGPMVATWEKDPAGGMALTVSSTGKTAAPARAESVPTDEQINQQVEEARAAWAKVKPKMEADYASLKIDQTYVLPGKVDEFACFQRAPGGVRLLIQGKQAIEGMDKLINDDAALRAAYKAGKSLNGDYDDETIAQIVFGQKAKICAHVAGDMAPRFDYQAQMQAALAAQPAMLYRLGLGEAGPPGIEAAPNDHPVPTLK